MKKSMALFIFFSAHVLFAQVSTTLNDFFMPGSQPNESGDLVGNQGPIACSCHLDVALPFDEWKSSMMAHAVVDPLYMATLIVAQQDADSSGDLCLRCHTPTGWLSGRSTPETDGSGLLESEGDFTSVNCMFCHRMIHPTPLGVDPYPDSTTYGTNTYPIDQAYLTTISDHIPDSSANGMYVVDSEIKNRRGPFDLASTGKHDKVYSPFHRNAALCGTCHDVSNPVYERQGDNTYTLNLLDTPSPSFDPYTMFPVERTYSEWLNSDYNTPAGISGTPFGGTKTSVSTCQDCHMPQTRSTIDGSGLDRDLKIHEMVGGNTFIPIWLDSTGYMTTEEKDSSIARATSMLQKAASLDVSAVGHTIEVTVYNETGHKLPSGYPEGRRIWLNVLAFNSGDTIYSSGEYNITTGVLTHDANIKVYEVKPGLAEDIPSLGLTAGPSFHFVLNNTIYKDNRIPPRGFSNFNFNYIQSPPVDYSYVDGEYWDKTTYNDLTSIPDSVVVTLYYQTTSKEYIEFLDSTNVTDSRGSDLAAFWRNNGKSAPVVMAQVTLNSADIPLYVNFANLSVEMGEKYPVLKWNTESETDNAGFIVYRREETEDVFSELSSYKNNDDLKGLGNSSHGKEYIYIDEDLSLIHGRTYFYKVADVDFSGKVTEHGMASLIFKSEKVVPAFLLKGNYPNPFNGETYIDFFISQKQPVAIYIYNTTGQLIRTFNNYLYYSGENRVKWDARDNYGKRVPSGVYFYSVKARGQKKVGKMVLLK